MSKPVPPFSVTQVWQYLIGRQGELNLESRIFNALCIIALIAIAYHIPFNYAIGLPVSALLSAFLFVVQGYLYYIARFKGRYRISIIVSGMLINLLFAINYYYNSGIDGPTLLLFALSFFLVIVVAPTAQYKFWIALNLLIVVFLLITDYHSPHWITNSYVNRLSRFTDTASAYIVTVVLIYTGTNLIRKNYYSEKRSVDQKALELQRLDAEKTRLLSIVSHDLRSPLSSIQGYLELLTELDLDLDERQQIKSELLDATRYTQDMLSNLLSWSKAELDGSAVSLSVLNVHETLDKTVNILRQAALKKGLHFTTDIHPGLNLKGNQDMLQLVVRNIITNAVKFTPVGGEINVSAYARQGSCIIAISDSGIGISEEKKADIFSFKTQSSFGTNNEKGIGLGLVLCHNFTQLQQGTIWLESEEGKGTTFYTSFKLA